MYTPILMDLDLLLIPFLTQMLHGRTQTGLYGPKRPAQYLGNLTLAESLVIRQLNDLAVLRLQRLHRKMQTSPTGFLRHAGEVRKGTPDVIRIVRIGQHRAP